MKRRDVLNSPRLLELKKKRKRSVHMKIFLFTFLVLVLSSAFIYITRSSKLNISKIEVIGNKVIDAESIQSIAEEKLSGKYLWLIPKTNLMFYPKDSIKKELEDRYKRLKDVNLNVKGGSTLEISMSEREGKYTWCRESLLEEVAPADGECFFMDESGYIFDTAPYFSGEIYFRFLGPLLPGAVPPGSTFIPEIFPNIVEFIANLKSLGINASSLYVKDEEEMEIYLSSTKSTLESPKIIFKKNADFENLAENLQAALSTEPLSSKFKNSYSSLEYIDLRFGNRVYYKFKGEAAHNE